MNLVFGVGLGSGGAEGGTGRRGYALHRSRGDRPAAVAGRVQRGTHFKGAGPRRWAVVGSGPASGGRWDAAGDTLQGGQALRPVAVAVQTPRRAVCGVGLMILRSRP